MTESTFSIDRSAFNKAVDRSLPARKSMALVIDVQDLARMDAIDAHNYVERLAETLTSIRDSQIPITWVTMRKNAQLYKPLKTDPETSSQTRDTDQLREMGFHGIDPEYDNHEIFKNFLLKHGPRTDEVVSCKSTKSALVEEIDAKQKPEYQNTLEAECGETLSTYFGSQEQTLADYMREQGINNTIIMGAVSSHCIAETAASSSVKGFNPNIITDRLLSWQGDEDKVDPKTSLLLWHGYSGNDNDWNSYHQSKLDNKLAEIMADISRDFSRQNLEDIGNIRFATSSILSEPLFSEKTEFGIQAAKFVRT